MGGDYSNSVSILFPLNFYSRPYVGGDPKFPAPWFNACIFLLTPPRGGDQLTLLMLTVLSISTHAPAWGATKHFTPYFSKDEQFLLTPPRRERPVKVVGQCTQDQFLLTPPHGGDEAYPSEIHRNPYFYSRPRVGGDVSGLIEVDTFAQFLLTPQNRGRTHRRGTPQAETGV